MESSGASTFCYFMGQRPNSIAVLDVWSHWLAPKLDVSYPAVVKATTTTLYEAHDHIKHFGPDRTILFIRNPVSVYSSLIKYPYANSYGTLEEKMARFDAVFGNGGFDLVLRYEDLVARDPVLIKAINNIGWPCGERYYDLTRSIEQIRAFNCAASPLLRDNCDSGWGNGNVRQGRIIESLGASRAAREVTETVAILSPHLSRHYNLDRDGTGNTYTDQPR